MSGLPSGSEKELDMGFNVEKKEGIGSCQGKVLDTLKGSDFMTIEEMRIIKDKYSEDISENVIKIVNDFCKNICSGRNPSNSLLNDICLEVVGEVDNNYIWFVKSVLLQFPDRKNIWYYLENNFEVPPQVVSEFIKNMGGKKEQLGENGTPQSGGQEVKPSESEDVENLGGTETIRIVHKQEKEYKVITKDECKEGFPNCKKAGNETEIRRLQRKNISISCDNGGGYYPITGNDTLVPTFDIRTPIADWMRNNHIKEIPSGFKCCFYNEKKDISHIIVFHIDRGPSAAINITVTGKISQEDAESLLGKLNEKNILNIDVMNGKVYKKSARDGNIYRFTEEDGEKIQDVVINYFNNGEYEKE